MSIINRTPHPINIYTTGADPSSLAPVITLPAAPRGSIARVETIAESPHTLRVGDVEVPTASQRWGQVTGLPALQLGVAHVVSAVVAAAVLCSDRSADDLLVPGEQVRDPATGQIVGARCLISARDAMPSLTRGAKVWCCYSVDDVRAWGVPEWAIVAACAKPGPVNVEVRGEWVLTSMSPGDHAVDRLPLTAEELPAWGVVTRVWELRDRKMGPSRIDLVEYVEGLLLRPHRRTISSV